MEEGGGDREEVLLALDVELAKPIGHPLRTLVHGGDAINRRLARARGRCAPFRPVDDIGKESEHRNAKYLGDFSK